MEASELQQALVDVFSLQERPTIHFPQSVDATLVYGTPSDPLPMLVAADSPPSEGEIPYFFHMPKVSGS
jgi:hypothetical protein